MRPIKSADNSTDILTKSRSKQLFQPHKNMMLGLIKPNFTCLKILDS